MKICYVILHYKNVHDTIKCIDSLFQTTDESSRLIVVDNGSGDNSGQIIKDKYKNTRCEVLLLPENVGFSKGNNEGYKYAKENYSPDFIVVTNNDVVFYQKDFEDNIGKLYDQTNFYVLGPDIYVPRHNDHQSPMFQNGITIENLTKELDEYKWYEQNPLKFNNRLKIHAFKNMLCSNSKIIRKIYTHLRGKDNLDYHNQYENVGLQGACLIFSKSFIDSEDKAFFPEPFLYEEEVFLYYRCKKNNYKTVYSPLLAIRHEEGASFTNSNKNNTDKLKFMLKHHVSSREQLLEYLQNSK